MQIKAITVNAAGMMAAGAGVQEKKNQMRAGNSMFGPECRVTISREGRNLSGLRTAQSEAGAENSQSVRKERAILRQQGEMDLAVEIREEYRRELNEIDEQIKALNASYASWEEEMRADTVYKNSTLGDTMKETVRELKSLRKAMQEQKDFQMEEAERRMEEAQQMAMQQSARCNEEINENNRDLVMLLRTIEEAEKAENERIESGSEASGAESSESDAIRNSALQFMTSLADREKGVEERLERAGESGRFYFDVADAVTQSVLQQSANIKEALDNEAFTDGQIEEMMQKFREEMELNYKDVKYSRSFGMEVLRNVRDARIQYEGDTSLRGAAGAKKSMMLQAADAALGEAGQSSLDKASKKLAEEVEELIDGRNSLNRTPKKTEREEGQDGLREELSQQEVVAG